MKFIPRTTAPDKNDKMYNSNENIYYAAGVGMPNCPAYVWSRLWEVTGQKPKFGLLNACDWYEEAKRLGYKVGSKPKLGAIICWAGAGKNPYGHVGFVEDISPESKARISESANGGVYWNNGLIVSPEDNYRHPGENHYTCQGFIYCGLDFSTPEEDMVRMTYIDVMCREADASGLSNYVNAINHGLSEESMRQSLINSDECKDDLNNCEKYYFIVKCYKIILGRYPESDDVVRSRLKMSKQDIFNSIWNSPEAQNRRNN